MARVAGTGGLPAHVINDLAATAAPVRVEVRPVPGHFSPAYQEVGWQTKSGTANGQCASFVFLLALIVALTVGFIVYAVVTSNELNDLRSDVKDLKNQAPPLMTTAVQAQQQRTPMRMDALVQRREEPEAKPAQLPAPSRAPVAERPQWATDLKPRWLQFETPIDDHTARLPPEGGHKGLFAAGSNGFKVECNFGGSVVQPTRDQVELTFFTNDESGDEYAVVRVPGPAFRGRECALEWMAQ